MPRNRSFGSDGRSVSDVVGYVLIFSLIVLSVGAVTVFGYQGLQEARDFERVNNAERAFDILADNVDDIAHDGAPSRATEVKLAAAQLRLGEPAVINVTGVHASSPAASFTREYETRPIVYDADTGTEITYETGAVIRGQRDGSVLSRQPNFVVSQDLVVLPIVVTREADRGRPSVGGSTTVLVRTEHAVSRVSAAKSSGSFSTVYLNVTSAYPAAWQQYLDSKDDVSCSIGAPPNDGTVYCELSSVDRVYVTTVEIDVAFE